MKAPYVIVVARKECRPYKTADGNTKTPSNPSNYHVSLLCIGAAEPTFIPQQLVIPDDVRLYLTETHKQFPFRAFGVWF